MPRQQRVGGANHEVDDFVRGVNHAEPVGGVGVVSLVKILVHALEEGLLFGVVGDFVGGSADGAVVCPQSVYGVPPRFAGEERLFKRVKPPRDVVLLVELVFPEHPQENVAREDVLYQHLADVRRRDVGPDGLSAQLQKIGGIRLVGGVLGFGVVYRLAQVGEDARQIGGELRLCALEFLYLRQFVIEESADEPMQVGGARHVGAHRPLAVLD